MSNDSPWVMIITGLLTFLAGGGGKWVIDFFNAKNKNKLDENEQQSKLKTTETKQQAELRLSETEKAFEIYKEIVDSLKKDMLGLNESIHKMESQHIECREENAKLNGKVIVLEQKVLMLESQLASKQRSKHMDKDKPTGTTSST
jgi:chromosome segregation ATPase